MSLRGPAPTEPVPLPREALEGRDLLGSDGKKASIARGLFAFVIQLSCTVVPGAGVTYVSQLAVFTTSIQTIVANIPPKTYPKSVLYGFNSARAMRNSPSR